MNDNTSQTEQAFDWQQHLKDNPHLLDMAALKKKYGVVEPDEVLDDKHECDTVE